MDRMLWWLPLQFSYQESCVVNAERTMIRRREEHPSCVSESQCSTKKDKNCTCSITEVWGHPPWHACTNTDWECGEWEEWVFSTEIRNEEGAPYFHLCRCNKDGNAQCHHNDGSDSRIAAPVGILAPPTSSRRPHIFRITERLRHEQMSQHRTVPPLIAR